MKTLAVLLAVIASTPEADPGTPSGQCDYQVSEYGYSCMPVITRFRVVKHAA